MAQEKFYDIPALINLTFNLNRYTVVQDISSPMIHQITRMQEYAGFNHKAIRLLDREIANLSAQNHVLARLHNNGVLNPAEYAAQSAEIQQKITERRTERR